MTGRRRSGLLSHDFLRTAAALTMQLRAHEGEKEESPSLLLLRRRFARRCGALCAREALLEAALTLDAAWLLGRR